MLNIMLNVNIMLWIVCINGRTPNEMLMNQKYKRKYPENDTITRHRKAKVALQHPWKFIRASLLAIHCRAFVVFCLGPEVIKSFFHAQLS